MWRIQVQQRMQTHLVEGTPGCHATQEYVVSSQYLVWDNGARVGGKECLGSAANIVDPYQIRALITLMVFSFARVGAALAMRVEDIYVQ